MMKKGNFIAVMCICVMLCLAACGSARPDASDLSANRERRNKEGAETVSSAAAAGDGASEDGTSGDEVSGDEASGNGTSGNGAAGDGVSGNKEGENGESAQTGGTKEGIVFGSPEASGCRDFKYLTEELIATSKTASREEAGFFVYIPKEEHPRVSGASARSEWAGVYVKVDLEPYLQYKAENYSLRGNLDKYITGEMEYYDNYYDISVGNIEETGDVAVCEVSYMEYDFYEEVYAPYYVIYSLHDLGDNVIALVTISIDAENTTEETKGLLDELSSFYQLAIHWDEAFAQAKRDRFEDKYTGNIYDVDCLSFKLPDGWEIDESMSYDFETFFAPGGDMEEAGGCFVVTEVSEAFGMVDLFLEDMDEMRMALEEELENEADYIVMEDIGMTFLGRTVMVEVAIHDVEDEGNFLLYLAEDDNNAYMIYAYSAFDEDAGDVAGLSGMVQEAVDMFFETGRVTDSFM